VITITDADKSAIWGNASASTGTGVGVRGDSDSAAGRGVWGTSPSGIGVNGTSTGGVGVRGDSSSNVGIHGVSSSYYGVIGNSNSRNGVGGGSSSGTGILGRSDSTTSPATVGHSAGSSTGLLGSSSTPFSVPPPAPAKTGVYGYAVQDSTSKGVWGRSNAGLGVFGQATTGSGLYGLATTGYALRTNGRLKADKVSGVATIAANMTSVTVTPGVDVTASSFLLLTPKANLGGRDLWFTTNATANTFTIRLSSSRTSNTSVAWLLLG
jgi:hypothetical protein